MSGDFLADERLFEVAPIAPIGLKDKFVFPPFSVLDRRQGEWQDRRRRWLAIGMKSEVGRDEGLAYGGLRGLQEKTGSMLSHSGTSIFDPVVCELVYRWFSPTGGQVLDPFAGGSVRGIVASHLERDYWGIDLRPEQIEANAEQLNIAGAVPPHWTEGDALDAPMCEGCLLGDGGLTVRSHAVADLVFTCPPYVDLEVYSDDPRDLSTMSYAHFLSKYGMILERAAAHLKPNRFFAIVVGDARGNSGEYYGLEMDTVRILRDLGLKLWSTLVIVDPVGTLALRAERQMRVTRKVGRCHQMLYVFAKGEGRLAAEACGAIYDAAEDYEEVEHG